MTSSSRNWSGPLAASWGTMAEMGNVHAQEAFTAEDVVVKEHLRGEELEQLSWQAAAKRAPVAKPRSTARQIGMPKREKERRVVAAA